MLWFVFALLTALCSASEAAVVKLKLSDLDVFNIVSYPTAYSLPLFAVAFFCVPTPEIGPGFWPAVVWLVPVNLAGFVTYLWGVKISPLSLTMPFMAFTPAIVLLTGFIFLGELPGVWGVVGVFVIVAGSYVLNMDSSKQGLWASFKAIPRERGSALVLLAATIFGLAAVLGKMIILESSAMYAACVFFLIHNTVALLLFWLSGKWKPGVLLRRPLVGLALGTLMFFHIVSHNAAISLVAAAYMIAVKRMSGIFAVMYGALIFKEKNIRLRLAGSALMAAGAAIISVFG